MHKLASYPISMECFETDDFCKDLNPYEGNPIRPDITMKTIWENLIIECENLRRAYHKLSEWHYFCDWIKTSLPYAEELITYGLDDAEN